MHYDFQFIKSGDSGNDWIIYTSDQQDLKSEPHPLSNPFFQQQFHIMHDIGIFDSENVLIYEEDFLKIIVFDNNNNIIDEYFIIAKFEHGGHNVYDKLKNASTYTIKIVGNIYEHEFVNDWVSEI